MRILENSMVDRLEHLRQLLEGYQAQLEGMERALLLAENLDKVRIQQNIEAKRSEMLPFEAEYQRLVAGSAGSETIAPDGLDPQERGGTQGGMTQINRDNAKGTQVIVNGGTVYIS
jgi:hypothetical protein